MNGEDGVITCNSTIRARARRANLTAARKAGRDAGEKSVAWRIRRTAAIAYRSEAR
jgi:hypothetical protein